MTINPAFTDDQAAREWLEAVRWPEGPFCPHCGEVKAVTRLTGEKHRPGVVQCNSCRKQFTVTVGTVFERSKVPLSKWLYATYLLSTSKKGISTHQLHRMLGVTYKTAWFMTHRIREAMADGSTEPMGGEGQTLEVDETYIGRKKGAKPSQSANHKHQVITLVERNGRARSIHVGVKMNRQLVTEILDRHADKASRLMTDEAKHYRAPGRSFASHESVNHHAHEYVRGDVTTNTVEGFFSIFKRGMIGTYQHCGEQHLQRYLAEFDFRYSNRKALGIDDMARTEVAMKGIYGKRLTYRRTLEG